MNKIIYYLLMVMLFATLGMTARAQSVTVGEVEAGPGPVSVPVYMEDFTNVDGFQLAFSFNPEIITGFDGIENRFVTGTNIIWAPQYNAQDGKVVVTFMDFDMNAYDIDEKVFDLKFQYAGGHDADIEFDLDNTDIMVNGNVIDNDVVTFTDGAILADPDLEAGTVSMETVTGVAPDEEVLMPIHMEGDGFTNISVIDLVIGFEPGQLIFEEVILNEDLEFDAVTAQLQADGELRIMLTSDTPLDLSDEEIANIRFTYTAITEAHVTFKPGSAIESTLGPLGFSSVDGVFVPDEFDVTFNIPDLFNFSGADVEVPVEIHGDFPSNAGSVSLRLDFDTDIIEYSGYQSDYGDNWSIGGTDPLIIELLVLDEDGIELVDGTDLITLRFDFVDVGTSPIKFEDGSAVKTPLGVSLPFNPNDGSVGIAVEQTVYDALLDARENTTLEVTNPESNVVETVTTYPDEFIESVEEGGFTVPALTDEWMVDAQFMSEEPIVAGTELHITYGDHTFHYMVEEDIPAATPHFLSELILADNPDADVRTVLLDHAGAVESWDVTLRSPVTYETTLHFAVITDNADFTNVEDGDAWWNGFMLDDAQLELTIYGDPQLILAVDGEAVGTGFEKEFCFGYDLLVTLHEVVVGEEPITIEYTVNGVEYTVDAEEGDVLFPTEDHPDIEAGTYEIVVTSIVDAAGIEVVDPQDTYYGTIIILPEPAVLFAFNEVVVETGSHLEFCFNEDVEVTLDAIVSGDGPVALTYVLNDDDPVTVEDVAEGDVLFGPDVLPVGHHTLHLTMLEDANGCQALDVDNIYTMEITVHPEPAVLFSFNEEIVETGSALHFLDDEVVTVKMHEIVYGTGPVELMYVLNDDDPVHVENVAEGDILFEDVLPVGDHTLHLTMLKDATGCEVIDPEDIYMLTIEVEKSIVDVATIAELRDMPEDGTVYRFIGEASLVAMDGFRNRKFLQDETAAILIDDQPGVITPEYDLYDVMTNVVGQLNTHNQMLQFQPTEDAPPADENEPVDATVFQLDEVTSDDQAKLIRFESVMFTDLDDGEEFANGTNYTITDGENEFTVRTDFWNVDFIGDPIPRTDVDITGVILQWGETFQLVPRFADDIEELVYDVTFVVEDEDGEAITDAVVTLGDMTNDAGDYVFADVLPGDYDYIVTADGYFDAEGTVSVVDDHVTETVTMILEAYTVTFNVVDEDGDAIGNAVVTLGDMTNDAGDYVFADVLPGNYNYIVTADGYLDAEGTVSVVDDHVTETVTMILEVYTVDFHVEDEHGNVIDDAIITFDGVTYSAGHYVFEDLMPGAYAYEVVRDGFFPVEGEVNVDDEDVTVSVEMLVDDTSIINPDDVELSIYPVPAQSTLYIESNADITDLRVVDMLGQVVYSSAVNHNRHEINVSNFQNGVYFLQMTTAAGVITHRIQVAK